MSRKENINETRNVNRGVVRDCQSPLKCGNTTNQWNINQHQWLCKKCESILKEVLNDGLLLAI